MFSGSIPALATPMRNGEFDESAFRQFVDWQIEGGSSALVPCGTTGEASTLNLKEHHTVIRTCIDQAAGRVPVIAGCGSNDTQTALWHMKEAQASGADAALCVVPYYNRPSQEGILAHFSYLAENCSIPIVLYNVPGRTVTDMLPDTVVELARRFPEQIVAIKDASGDLSRVVTQRVGAGPDFCQISGDDGLVLAGTVLGQSGCISVSANVAPQLCAEFQAACAAGDFATARDLNEKLYPLHGAMFSDSSPAPAKYALSRIHDWFAPDVRLPIAPCSDAAKAQVDAALEGLGLV